MVAELPTQMAVGDTTGARIGVVTTVMAVDAVAVQPVAELVPVTTYVAVVPGEKPTPFVTPLVQL
jgi:hypothetical protein